MESPDTNAMLSTVFSRYVSLWVLVTRGQPRSVFSCYSCYSCYIPFWFIWLQQGWDSFRDLPSLGDIILTLNLLFFFPLWKLVHYPVFLTLHHLPESMKLSPTTSRSCKSFFYKALFIERTVKTWNLWTVLHALLAHKRSLSASVELMWFNFILNSRVSLRQALPATLEQR